MCRVYTRDMETFRDACKTFCLDGIVSIRFYELSTHVRLIRTHNDGVWRDVTTRFFIQYSSDNRNSTGDSALTIVINL